MSDVKASSKALKNLDQALKANKIDMVTYHHEKDQIETRLNSVYDDCGTRTKGKLTHSALINNLICKTSFLLDLIELISACALGKAVSRRMLCTKLDHYSSGFIDTGYGCGYRNSQMLLSSIREDPAMRDTIFNHSK